MAANNLINLVTDVFNPDAVNALKDNLGIDIFSGEAPSLGDLTGSGWLFIAAVNSLVRTDLGFDAAKVKNTLKDILGSQDSGGEILKYQTNSKGDNLTTQAFVYARDNDIPADIVLSLLEYVFTSAELENQLKHVNSSGISAAMIIASSQKLTEEFYESGAFTTYYKTFLDISYDKTNKNLLPIGRLLVLNTISGVDAAKDAINAIIDSVVSGSPSSKWDFFNKIFFPFPDVVVSNESNSLVDFIYSVGADTVNNALSDVMQTIVTKTISSNENDGLNILVSSVATDNCVGIKYGETGFNLNTYKAQISDYEPLINFLYHVVKKLGNKAKIDSFYYNYLSPFLFPVPASGNIEGYTLLALMCETLEFNSSGVVDSNILEAVKSLLKKAANKVSTQTDKLKKFFLLNAYLGTPRDFSGGATMNLYSPINVLLNKINNIHKQWCTENNKSFDDYKTTFSNIIADLFGTSDVIDFDTAYKYWCNEYEKMF